MEPATARLRSRSEIAVTDTWNLDDIYTSWDAWDADLRALESQSLIDHECADFLSENGVAHIGRLVHVEDKNRNFVIHAEAECG